MSQHEKDASIYEAIHEIKERLESCEKRRASLEDGYDKLRGALADMEHERDQWMKRAGRAEERLRIAGEVLAGRQDPPEYGI